MSLVGRSGALRPRAARLKALVEGEGRGRRGSGGRRAAQPRECVDGRRLELVRTGEYAKPLCLARYIDR